MAAQFIPKDFIDELLTRSSIEQVIEPAVHLKRSGKNFTACCPFHDEKTPSFTVSTEKQFYYCFGCGAHGNALSFLINFYKISFVEAVQRLASSLGLTVPQADAQEISQRQTSAPLYQVMEQSQNFFQQQLKNPLLNSAAIQYLEQRGLNADIIHRFGVGYAPPGWNNLADYLQTAHVPHALAEQAGLILIKDDQRHYDRFRDRIMFPIRDPRGRVIAFGGRVTSDAKPKYLNSPETPIFKKNHTLYGLFEAQQNTANLQRLLVVEGYMDVIALAQAGISYAVATLGTSVGSSHVELLFRQVNQIIFCFDGDEAGNKAAFRALEASLPAMKDGRQVQFLWLPSGEDPDSLVRKEGVAAFQQRIEHASHLADYLFEYLCESLQLSTLEGKAQLTQRAKPLIAQIPPGIFQQLLWKRLADITQLSTEQLQQFLLEPLPTHQTITASHTAIKKPTPIKSPIKKSLPAAAIKKTASLNLIQALIRLLLQDLSLAQTLSNISWLKEIELPYMDLLLELTALAQQKPDLSTAYLLGHWHNTEQGEQLAQLAAQEFLLTNLETHTQVFNDALEKLADIYRQQQLEAELQKPNPDPQRVKHLLEKIKQSAF